MNKTKWVLVEIAQKRNFLPYTIRYKAYCKTIEHNLKETGQSTEVVMAHPVKICIKD
jgi:azurin